MLSFHKGCDPYTITQQFNVLSIFKKFWFYNLPKIWKIEIQNLAKPNSASLSAGKQSSANRKGGHSCYIEFKGKFHVSKIATVSPKESCSGGFHNVCIYFPFSIVFLFIWFSQYHGGLPQLAQVSPSDHFFPAPELNSSHPDGKILTSASTWPTLPVQSLIWVRSWWMYKILRANTYSYNSVMVYKTLNAGSKLAICYETVIIITGN